MQKEYQKTQELMRILQEQKREEKRTNRKNMIEVRKKNNRNETAS